MRNQLKFICTRITCSIFHILIKLHVENMLFVLLQNIDKTPLWTNTPILAWPSPGGLKVVGMISFCGCSSNRFILSGSNFDLLWSKVFPQYLKLDLATEMLQCRTSRERKQLLEGGKNHDLLQCILEMNYENSKKQPNFFQVETDCDTDGQFQSTGVVFITTMGHCFLVFINY